MNEKILVAKIYLDGSNPLVIPVSDLSKWLSEERESSEPEDWDRYKITIAEMYMRELEALPEHQGW